MRNIFALIKQRRSAPNVPKHWQSIIQNRILLPMFLRLELVYILFPPQSPLLVVTQSMTWQNN